MKKELLMQFLLGFFKTTSGYFKLMVLFYHNEEGYETQISLKTRKISKEKEIGGPQGPEPTRYGDWGEKKESGYDFQPILLFFY